MLSILPVGQPTQVMKCTIHTPRTIWPGAEPSSWSSPTVESWDVVNPSTRLGLLTDHQNRIPQFRVWHIALISYNVIELVFTLRITNIIYIYCHDCETNARIS